MAEKKSLQAAPEQLTYAGLLEKGMYLGLLLLLVTFLIYVFGVIKPYIPVAQVPSYWHLNVNQYLEATHTHSGWSWVGMLRYGDFLNFVGIAILAGLTIVCFLAIIPILWRNDDKVYAVLALVEVIILCVAASGILGAGGH